jgi:hypothetical protein
MQSRVTLPAACVMRQREVVHADSVQPAFARSSRASSWARFSPTPAGFILTAALRQFDPAP